MIKPTLGISGDIASFSEEAGLLYAKKVGIDFDFHYLIDMEGVLDSVENGKVDKGILPVVNLHGGLVKMAFEAMGRHSFIMVDEIWLKVNQCLLALPDVSKNQIKNIRSHSQAFLQCQKYLKDNFNHCELIEEIDTAQSARELFMNKNTFQNSAVIASARAASEYGLEILERNIQDVELNLTGFIVITR